MSNFNVSSGMEQVRELTLHHTDHFLRALDHRAGTIELQPLFRDHTIFSQQFHHLQKLVLDFPDTGMVYWFRKKSHFLHLQNLLFLRRIALRIVVKDRLYGRETRRNLPYMPTLTLHTSTLPMLESVHTDGFHVHLDDSEDSDNSEDSKDSEDLKDSNDSEVSTSGASSTSSTSSTSLASRNLKELIVLEGCCYQKLVESVESSVSADSANLVNPSLQLNLRGYPKLKKIHLVCCWNKNTDEDHLDDMKMEIHIQDCPNLEHVTLLGSKNTVRKNVNAVIRMD